LILKNGEWLEVEVKNWSKGFYWSWIRRNLDRFYKHKGLLVVNDEDYLKWYRFKDRIRKEFNVRLLSYCQFLWYAYEHGILGKRSKKPTNFVSVPDPIVDLIVDLGLCSKVGGLGVGDLNGGVSDGVALKSDDVVCGNHRCQLREHCKPAREDNRRDNNGEDNNRGDDNYGSEDEAEAGFRVGKVQEDGFVDDVLTLKSNVELVGYRCQFTGEYSKHTSFERSSSSRSLSKCGEYNYKVSDNACQCLSRHLLPFTVHLKRVIQRIRDSILNMKKKLGLCIFKVKGDSP